MFYVNTINVITFPVKPESVTYAGVNTVSHMRSKFKYGDIVPGWAAIADLAIIERSLKQVIQLADIHPNWNTILIPRVGCGAGELNYETEVRQLMFKYLDSSFVICTY